MHTKLIILLTILVTTAFSAPKVTVINSTQEQLQLHVFVNPFSIDDFKPFHVLIGLPNDKYPELQIQRLNKQNLTDFADSIEAASVEWIQKQKLRGLNVATLKIAPGSDGRKNDQYFQEITITINFDSQLFVSDSKLNDNNFSTNVINWSVAKYWKQSKAIKRLKFATEFPSGQWLKFDIKNDGMYQLNGTDLLNLIPTIDQHNTRSFVLYTGSNLGRSQSQNPGAPTPNDNFTEIAFRYTGSSDGTFSENDNIIFYGRGPSGFDLEGTNVTFNKNLYFENNIYWLLIPDDNSVRGKRVTEHQSTASPIISLDYGLHYQHIETDLVNPFQSGLGWVEQSISTNNFLEKTLNVNTPVNDILPKLIVGFQGGTTDKKVRPAPSNKIAIRLNSQQNTISNISWTGLNQRSVTITLTDGSLINGSNSFYFTNNSNDSYSQPYFDNLALSYGRQLIFTGEPFEFYTPIHSNPINFTMASSINPTIWNISDVSTALSLSVEQSANNYSFNVSPIANSYDRLIVFDSDNISTITNIKNLGRINFNTLRNSVTQTDHIIIAPNEYLNVASKFISHRTNSIFASLEVIYDEFSGGNADPMAIRNFIDWTQNNWQSPKPIYIFILGDADYDYRNITGNSNNIVPTVEVGVIGSYATDDRLAAINGRIPEVAIGRFPARTVAEAENYIDKLIEFETNPEFGLWRQRVTLIADDAARPEDTISELNIGKSHTINSEILADIIPPTIETYKLYMMEFPEESDATSFGVAKPEATSALFDILEKGTAIVNYIGHGSAHQWAQERLLYQDRGDLQAIKTGMKLPLWIAGTCSWGHFDDINRESFSEELIRQPMNGACAIITTSRPITVTSNQYYEEQLFNKIFPNQTVSELPIGVILQSIKTGNQEGEYFHLFGDPAMQLSLPKKEITITNVTPDTLQTLGESEYTAEQNITQSGGEGFVILNDAERNVTREYNFLSNIESLSYKLSGATLFRGKFSFNNNLITGKLRVPKDISFSDKPASIKLYILSDDSEPIEALGWKDSLYIVSGDPTSDNFGPIINFETSKKRILRSGDHIQESDEILIRLTDPVGINLTGEIGHNIVLTDKSNDDSKTITDDFIYDNNSITTGTIPLESDENSIELHISLKAWDSANNPTESEILLHRITNAKLKLFNVTNFPNPFSNSTQFTFELSRPADVSVDIFTLGGRKIMQIEPEYFSVGFHAIDWDGKDAFGDKLANGVYLYRLKAIGDEESASFIGRLAKYE